MKSQIIRSKILNAQLLGLLSICFLTAVQLVLAYFKLLGGVEASWDGDESYVSASSSRVAFTVNPKAEPSGGIPGYPPVAVALALLASVLVLSKFSRARKLVPLS